MAVINSPYVGNARGKLGDAVLYRSKGNTIARAYNPEPKNRRTVSQQSQRSVFSAAVKFYARGVQNLFLFAFENKKPQESDYNAFMRYNANRGMYFGPAQNDDDTYPALGDFVLTRGSLGSFNSRLSEAGPVFDMPLATLSETPTTLGALSAALIDAGLMEGDIITFLGITTDSGLGTAAAPVEVGSEVPSWNLRQFTLDLSSGDTLASLGLVAEYFSPPGVLSVYPDNFGSYDEGIASGAVVVSRQDGGLLRVSNSNLMLNEAAQAALDLGRGITWRNVVMNAWSAEQLSILQGGISLNSVSPETGLRVAYQFTTPITNSALDGLGMITSEALSTSRFASLIRMTSGGSIVQWDGVTVGGTVSMELNGEPIGSWELDTDNPRLWKWANNSAAAITFSTISLTEP